MPTSSFAQACAAPGWPRRETELSERQIALGSGGSATVQDIKALERDNARLQEDIDAFCAALR
jgi:hypothetical protein